MVWGASFWLNMGHVFDTPELEYNLSEQWKGSQTLGVNYRSTSTIMVEKVLIKN